LFSFFPPPEKKTEELIRRETFAPSPGKQSAGGLGAKDSLMNAGKPHGLARGTRDECPSGTQPFTMNHAQAASLRRTPRVSAGGLAAQPLVIFESPPAKRVHQCLFSVKSVLEIKN